MSNKKKSRPGSPINGKRVSSITPADMASVGFDLKLSKEDLFDIAIDKMIEEKGIRLAQLHDEKGRLLADADAKINVMHEELFSKNTFLNDFMTLEKAEKKIVRENQYSSFVAQYRCDATAIKDGQRMYLTIHADLSEENVNMCKELHEKQKTLNEQIIKLMCEIDELKTTPRKAKVAFLRTMLSGTDMGRKILEMFGNLNAPVKMIEGKTSEK
jgi:hypothetical protein